MLKNITCHCQKRILVSLALFWGCLGALFGFCEEQEQPVGMIMNVRGDVQLLEAGQEKFRQGDVADFIFTGSQIQTGKESQAVIALFFEACRRLEIGESSMIAITEQEWQMKQGAILKEETIKHCYRPGQMSAETGTVPGGTVLRSEVPPIEGLFPSNNTVIIHPHPEFRWKGASAQTHYRFTLYHAAPDKQEGDLIWQSQVAENHLAYPSSQLPLVQGEGYRWKVEALNGEHVTAQGIGTFRVLDKENMVRVEEMRKSSGQTPDASDGSTHTLDAANEMNDPTPYLLSALLYEHLGAWGEALSEYQRIAEHFPDSPALQRSIAFMYDTLRLEDEAQKIWAVVEQLEKMGKNENE